MIESARINYRNIIIVSFFIVCCAYFGAMNTIPIKTGIVTQIVNLPSQTQITHDPTVTEDIVLNTNMASMPATSLLGTAGALILIIVVGGICLALISMFSGLGGCCARG